MAKHNKVRIRNTHPALYRSILILAIMSMALAVNFWFSNPTFSPLGIPKNAVGAIFILLGVSQFLFLNVFHNLRMVRLILAVSLGWFCFWGLINTIQFFAGNASLQLPILYVFLAVLHAPLLVEPPVNTTTQRDDR